MTRANPAYTSFNAGELSPLLGGRPDLEKWNAALQRCENMIPRVQGALQRAGGTMFVGEVKSGAPWLAPFVFSQTDAFVLEFGPGYIRFYRDRGRLVTGEVAAWDSGTAYAAGDLASNGGVTYYCTTAHTNHEPPDGDYWHALEGDIYEVPTPYEAADLVRDDGTFGVRFEQSLDIIYLACAGHSPKTLSRLGNLRWVLADFQPAGGPFKDQNKNEDITVTVTGTHTVGGAVTITANADIFQAGHVGSLFEVDLMDGADVRAWQVRVDTDVGDIRRFGTNFYKCTQLGPINTSDKPAVNGETAPVHIRGKVWDGTGEEQKGDGAIGSIGAEWEYLHSGYGTVRITGYTSPTEVTGEVVLRLPSELATEATHRWAHAGWSDVEGWPDNVCFFRERLTFFRGQQVWHSIVGGFDDFKAREYGVVRDDSAIVISIQSAQGNPLAWAAPLRDVLLLGSFGGEHVLHSQSSQKPYAPGNTQQDPQTAIGGTGVDPVVCAGGAVFVEKLGRKLRLMIADDQGFSAQDLNKYHGLLPAAVVSMAWQQTPHEAVWCALANGELRGLTLQVDDGVVGWHRHDVGGLVEGLAVIPAPDGGRDDVWMIVRRTINGVSRRYVEYRAAEYEAGDNAALSVYANSALIYSSDVATATLTGLEHLEGEEVSIKADGATHPAVIVTDGAVSLTGAVNEAVVGLPATWKAKIMPMEAGAAMGTAQARPKRAHHVWVRLLDSLGGRLGPDFGTTDPIEYRTAETPMDAPPPLFTGDKGVPFPGGYERTAAIAIEGDGPHPFTLLALFPEITTYEG